MRLLDLEKMSVEELSSTLNLRPEQQPIAQKFLEMQLPTRKSEAYRYFEVEPWLREEYQSKDFLCHSTEYGDKIIIENGCVTTAPKGIRVYSAHCENIDMNHYDPLYYLGHLLSPQVIMIEIDGDSDIEILHRLTKANSLLAYRIVLVNQANRHASFYESFESQGVEDSLILYGYDIRVQPHSTLRLIKNQTIVNDAYRMVASHSVNVESNSTMMLKSFDFGDSSALQLFNISLQSHASIEMGQLLYLKGSAKRGTISRIVHQGEHTTSSQESKNILDGESRGIFDALIKVSANGRYSKVEQNAKSILLQQGAYMVSKPQLEIYIDELEASHGSTTGQLDENQLFYLQSRGISETEARKMLVLAFAHTLIERVRDQRQAQKITESFEEAFYAQKETL